MNPAQRARFDIREKRRTGTTRGLAFGLRTDLPRYSAYENGKRRDVEDLKDLWRPDLVAFLIGSGITFDGALERAGVPTDRHRWVLNSRMPTVPAGRFRGFKPFSRCSGPAA